MAQTFPEFDRKQMTRALALARRGQGRVEPNPMVGCVVTRGRRVIAEGYHRRFGGPHAEVDAIRSALDTVRGATVYVTLEPCCHHGKTPPCTDALIDAGVRRVVAAMPDPNERVNGKGFAQLRRNGISVEVGLMEKDATALNRPYVKLLTQRRPYVILKWAQSLDGKMATRTGDSKWISGVESRRQVHRLRARVDAILVGIGTVLADDPMLTARGVPVKRTAARVVLDTKLRVPETCRLVRSAGQFPTVVFTSARALRTGGAKRRRLERRGVIIERCALGAGAINLTSVLDRLGQRAFTNVLVEGGSRVLSACLDQRLADEAFIFVAPMLLGGRDSRSAYEGDGAARVCDGLSSAGVRLRRVRGDQLYHLIF